MTGALLLQSWHARALITQRSSPRVPASLPRCTACFVSSHLRTPVSMPGSTPRFPPLYSLAASSTSPSSPHQSSSWTSTARCSPSSLPSPPSSPAIESRACCTVLLTWRTTWLHGEWGECHCLGAFESFKGSSRPQKASNNLQNVCLQRCENMLQLVYLRRLENKLQ